MEKISNEKKFDPIPRIADGRIFDDSSLIDSEHNGTRLSDEDIPKPKKNVQVKSIDSIVVEFHEKSELIAHCPYFDFNECYCSEYIQWIFERKVRYKKEVQPFEDIQSKEYKHWLKQKTTGARVMDYHGYACWRYNPIVFYIDEDKPKKERNRHRIILKDDDETISFLDNRKFAIMAPITYVGRNNTSANARYMYAFGFDLDGVGPRQLNKLFRMMNDNVVPPANIIVNSGHGLHLYYILDNPVALYEEGIPFLNKIKHGLTNVIWNENTSVDEFRQHQSIFQGFRLPGTLTKFGEPIRAFHNSDVGMYSLESLNNYLTKFKLTNAEINKIGKAPIYNPTGVTVQEAERRWPEWYANRIVEKKRIGKKWNVNRAVYDWWLNKLRNTDEEIKIHHRYWCILTLVVYAVKCNISKEEVLADAYSLVSKMESYTDTEDNHFTEEDVDDAMKAYDENYCKWPIDTIEATTTIHIERNRRNGVEQKLHLKLARIRRDLLRKSREQDAWDANNGRIYEAEKVMDWRNNNPECTNKSQCARELGLHRNTVMRWWNGVIIGEKRHIAKPIVKEGKVVLLARLFAPESKYRVEGYTHEETVEIVSSGRWKELGWDIGL